MFCLGSRAGSCCSLLARAETSGCDVQKQAQGSTTLETWHSCLPRPCLSKAALLAKVTPRPLPTLTSATIRWYCGSCCPSDATSTVLNLSGSCFRCWAIGLLSCWGRSLSCDISSNNTQLVPRSAWQSIPQLPSKSKDTRCLVVVCDALTMSLCYLAAGCLLSSECQDHNALSTVALVLLLRWTCGNNFFIFMKCAGV